MRKKSPIHQHTRAGLSRFGGVIRVIATDTPAREAIGYDTQHHGAIAPTRRTVHTVTDHATDTQDMVAVAREVAGRAHAGGMMMTTTLTDTMTEAVEDTRAIARRTGTGVEILEARDHQIGISTARRNLFH